MNVAKYRLYPDGTVLHEDDFEEDVLQSYSDDFQTVSIPLEILDYIQETFCSGCLLYNKPASASHQS